MPLCRLLHTVIEGWAPAGGTLTFGEVQIDVHIFSLSSKGLGSIAGFGLVTRAVTGGDAMRNHQLGRLCAHCWLDGPLR
jgi:hypothetical protein